jgi:hypothetical protein
VAIQYLLDTNILSDLLKNPQGKVARKISALPSGERNLLATSIIVASELRYGVAKSGSSILAVRVDQLLEALEILPLSPKADRGHTNRRQRSSYCRPCPRGRCRSCYGQHSRIQACRRAARGELAPFLIVRCPTPDRSTDRGCPILPQPHRGGVGDGEPGPRDS